ncbi:MAG: MFS transporter [Sulfolobales archaeon]|nr:MFS transporter [Sulfolobales archaeon]MDW8082511.1 MFS transporter [Sulfolobales archaeon]
MRRELLVFLILGLVSLTADVAYEGARSISGPLLENLEAVPIAAAVVGSGEFVSYVARFLGGYICTVFRSSVVLWATVVFGYLVNLVVIPLLAFVGRWELAVTLYIIERVGKGLRAPSRDTILAEVTSSIGRGKGFGIHEVMDQVGAFLGPLAVSLAISTGGYRLAFLSLSLPAALSVTLVVTAAALYPRVESTNRSLPEPPRFRGLPKHFWIYTLSMSSLLAGYIHWTIASMYMASEIQVSASEIALAYSIAMAIDAIVALPAGVAYDRYGLKSLVIAPPVAFLAITVLVSSESSLTPYTVGTLWGIVMGLYETNMRAAVADFVEPQRRSLAYGTFGLLTGLSWSIGGFAISTIASNKLLLLIYVLAMEVASLTTLLGLLKARVKA